MQLPADPIRIGDTAIFQLVAIDANDDRTIFGYIISLITAPDDPVHGLTMKDDNEHWLINPSYDADGLDTLLSGSDDLEILLAAGGAWSIMEPTVAAIVNAYDFQFYDDTHLGTSDWTATSGQSPTRPSPTHCFVGTDIDGTTPVRALLSPDANNAQALAQVVWETDDDGTSRYFDGNTVIGSKITLARQSTLPSALDYWHQAS